MLISNLLLDFLQRFLETSAGGYRENSSNPMISKAYQATNGMSIVVEGGRLYSILRFQTFFPSINWNSVLDSDFDGGGWIYAAAPALPSADAINKPNVTLQQWQLAAVFHWEAPLPSPSFHHCNTKDFEVWEFLRNIFLLCRRNVFHAALGRLTAYWFIGGSGGQNIGYRFWHERLKIWLLHACLFSRHFDSGKTKHTLNSSCGAKTPWSTFKGFHLEA